MSVETQRLLQAIDHFQARTKGEALPDGVGDAVKGLQESLGKPMPTQDTPGSLAAQKASPGGEAVPMEFAAKGPDSASPGQRAASGKPSVSQEISKAAEAIIANVQQA